jgi:alcohol/geraniol dehydrogenase (NADP+)
MAQSQWIWATPLPQGIKSVSAGPLFCGGVTVFNPMVQHELKPTARVGVVGIGGLGHLALQFLHHWGCEVIAFSSNPNKRERSGSVRIRSLIRALLRISCAVRST